MSFDEQISAFMDGALNAEEEVEFLHILSVSPEKRALFHSYLGVQSVMAADARSVAVPSQLDSAVLGAAGALTAVQTGAQVAATGAAAGTGAAIVGGAAAWWTGAKVATAIILGLSLFGAGYFLSERLTDSTVESALSDNSGPTTTQGTSVQTPAENTSAMSQNDNLDDAGSATRLADNAHLAGEDETRTQSNVTERIVYRDVYVTRVDTVYVNTAQDTRATAVTRTDTVTIALMQSRQNERPITINEAPRRELDISLPGRIEFEVEREHLNTYPYIDHDRLGVERAQQQFAIAAAYVFNEHHAAGLNLGQKSFALEYFRVSGDSLYLYQQQPELLHGGGFYRFSYPMATGIVPEFTLQIGGSDLGPVLGGRLGVRLAPFDRISIILGINGTLLAYRYNDKLFTSHNLGLSYGLRYRF